MRFLGWYSFRQMALLTCNIFLAIPLVQSEVVEFRNGCIVMFSPNSLSYTESSRLRSTRLVSIPVGFFYPLFRSLNSLTVCEASKILIQISPQIFKSQISAYGLENFQKLFRKWNSCFKDFSIVSFLFQKSVHVQFAIIFTSLHYNYINVLC